MRRWLPLAPSNATVQPQQPGTASRFGHGAGWLVRLSLWGYLLVRNLHELDIHSGIISPLGKLMPIYAPAEHHDLHHSKPTKGNYASTFELWDRVLGTYWRPR